MFPAGAARGTTARVTAAGTFPTWPVRVWASDPAVTGTADAEKGSLKLTVGRDAKPGLCWLRLFDRAGGASPLRPFVVGVLPDVAEAEPNDMPSKPQRISDPAVVNGKLAKNGDVDCFAVEMAKGHTLVASVEAHTALRSPMDAVLQIVSPHGAVLEQNHDHDGLDPRLAFTAPAAGTYLVRLFAFPAEPDSSIRHFGSEACVYRLTVTTGGFVEAFTPLAVEAGKKQLLALRGWNLTKPSHRLSGRADHFVAAQAANGGTARRELHPCFDLTRGPTPEALAPPFTVTGRVSVPGEPAVVPFTAEKGTPLTVRVDVPSPLPLRPVVRLTDATGKLLATAEPAKLAADCEATFTPTVAGLVRIEVRDLYRAGGQEYDFLLRVTPNVRDFAPTVTTDRLIVVAGKPFDVSVTVGGKHGFADELTWTVEGLPPTVTFRPVEPAGKAKANAIVLRFESETPGFGGPVRIVAATKSQTRTATAKLADFETTTTDMWLTVAPPVQNK